MANAEEHSTAAHLARFMTARRLRGAKPDGVPMDGEIVERKRPERPERPPRLGPGDLPSLRLTGLLAEQAAIHARAEHQRARQHAEWMGVEP
jgi:hypothetical protein